MHLKLVRQHPNKKPKHKGGAPYTGNTNPPIKITNETIKQWLQDEKWVHNKPTEKALHKRLKGEASRT